MAEPTPTELPPQAPLPDLPADLVDPGTSPVQKPGEIPRRRKSDLKPWYLRWLLWDRDDWVQVVVVSLLAILVLSQVSDTLKDRAQSRVNDRIACQVDNVAQTNNESIRRLREQAPVMEAGRELAEADDPVEEAKAVQKLRERVALVGPPHAGLETRDCG